MIHIMGNFRRDSSDRGGRDRGGSGGRFFGGRGGGFGRSNDGPREMFKTVCSNCGKECEVPFKPTSGKPVYCSDCFEKMGGRNTDSGRNDRTERTERSERPERREAPRENNSGQFNDLNAKLDKIIALLTPKVEEVVVVEKEVKTPKVKKASKPKETLAE